MGGVSRYRREVPLTSGHGPNGVVLTTGAGLIWGTSFVAISMGLHYVNPYMLLFERFLVASVAVLLIGIFYRSARVWPELRKPWMWALGAVYTAGFLSQFVGQDMAGASLASLLSNLFVIFTPVVAYFVLKERPNAGALAGVVVGVFGVVLVYSSSLASGGTALGDLLLIGSALGYTVFIVMSKKLHISSLSSSFALMVVMTIESAPVVFVGGPPSAVGFIQPWGLLALLWLGIPCTVVALAMYTRGLSYTGASQSAVLLLVEIVVGVGLSFLLLGESLSSVQWVGAVVIGLSILVSSGTIPGVRGRGGQRAGAQ
ncbi:MAG: DMT family transporter [Nitrososphaerota archaeon]|nr:DMT family transporter [Nitrososphaerota archaeon]